jgi:amino-acid N-acetyltransferase
VTATERNRGLGRFLIEELLTRARQEQLAELVLLTTTAEKFFFRIGFRTIQRGQVPLAAQSSVEFQSACPASATVMLLKL